MPLTHGASGRREVRESIYLGKEPIHGASRIADALDYLFQRDAKLLLNVIDLVAGNVAAERIKDRQREVSIFVECCILEGSNRDHYGGFEIKFNPQNGLSRIGGKAAIVSIPGMPRGNDGRHLEFWTEVFRPYDIIVTKRMMQKEEHLKDGIQSELEFAIHECNDPSVGIRLDFHGPDDELLVEDGLCFYGAINGPNHNEDSCVKGFTSRIAERLQELQERWQEEREEAGLEKLPYYRCTFSFLRVDMPSIKLSLPRKKFHEDDIGNYIRCYTDALPAGTSCILSIEFLIAENTDWKTKTIEVWVEKEGKLRTKPALREFSRSIRHIARSSLEGEIEFRICPDVSHEKGLPSKYPKHFAQKHN